MESQDIQFPGHSKENAALAVVVLLECGNVKKVIYIVNCAAILSHFSHIINCS